MEKQKSGNLGFSIIGGVHVALLACLLTVPCSAVVLYLVLLMMGGITDSAAIVFIVIPPVCGGIIGIIALIAGPFILYKLNLPWEHTRPALIGGAISGIVTFVLLLPVGILIAYVEQLNKTGALSSSIVIQNGIVYGIALGIPLGLIAAPIGFFVVYVRRSIQKRKEIRSQQES